MAVELTWTVTVTTTHATEVTVDDILIAMHESPLYAGDTTIPGRVPGERDDDYVGRLAEHRAWEGGLLALRQGSDISDQDESAGDAEWSQADDQDSDRQ